MKYPKVTVLLAAFNGVIWLEEQVQSILNQRNVDITLFISVDASHDGTEEWVQALAARDSRVLALVYGRRFGSASGNFFTLFREADLAIGSYVALADQDDIWDPGKLERALQLLGRNEADAYSGNVTALWPDGSRSLVCKSQPQRKWDHLFEAAGPGCTYVFTPLCAARIRDFLRANQNALKEVSLHDWLLYAYVRGTGGTWVIDEEPQMLYRQHEHNHVGVNTGWSAWRNRLQLISGGWWLSQARLIAKLTQPDSDPFVGQWSNPRCKAGYLFLARHALDCRRNRRDGIFMAAICLYLSMAPS